MSEQFDLLVIGGGINGAGIARDAAGRGMRVLLVEKDDLAGHTSSASTKLVHGGLRYLEHYEFRLVRESLIERERLWGLAPHVIWPLRFVLPHDRGLRPKWMLRLGLFLYDHLGGRKRLPPTRTINLTQPPHGRILQDRLTSGFEYSDCWVEDSRLVSLNAVDAAAKGADVRTRTECTALERGESGWAATLRCADAETTVLAKAVVNAAGPWVDKVLGRAIPEERHANLRMVKGSHLIFPRLFEGDHCYIFQNRDERIVFAIPYERDFTLVGTTDLGFDGDPQVVEISPEEADYICAAANEYLAAPVSPDQAVSSYSGVRPLYEDKSASNSTVTRDYVFELDSEGGAPILSIFGGKITTYRKLAEHALERLSGVMAIPGEEWTAMEPLPGGDMVKGDFDAFLAQVRDRYPAFAPEHLLRLARAYGTRIDAVIGDAARPQEMGEHFGGDLYEDEVAYLVEHEFAHTAEDVLWRRSKLGLHLDSPAQARLADWFARRGLTEH
ncbi:glycerol-3-phosphate dehydrogenase [Alteriqipengyuania sp. WL0013]|uniref:glycerol-3-phosphate dehydrogenase n=1 Tax=Alteriqipengyuania sp. WL0013 TaxID=3110773 RepID=UPI002C81C76C|nr:glycerol-3-phosphate dehydrogenase [Alteriqipengyuania sp. WL0013]MEB3414636.1 glycerol-3-phosphate dehydrogenase [Alteriqipengyuania sp. WL0013]